MNLRVLLRNKESKNALWIIFGKACQMLLAFVVNIWSARFLGPSNYGLLSYVLAYIAFFTSFCTLGITSAITINELTNQPDSEGETLGSIIGLRFVSSLLSAIMIICIIAIIDKDEPVTIVLAVLSSLSLLFQVFDVFEYWFQKRYMSKITSIATLFGYVVATLYKIFLLISKQTVHFFALANSIDYLVVAVFLYIVYKKNNGPKLSFSFKRCKEILSKSYHFILSGLMVSIYGQTDKMMLKQMLTETDVGYYSVASSLSTVWVFVLAAIITSLSPTIMQNKMDGKEEEYKRKNRQLYCIIIYSSLIISVIFSVAAPLIIKILYGEDYSGAVLPLRIITWCVAFSYLGVARDVWLVCEQKEKYVKYIYLIAAILNVVLNYLIIPVMGAAGAALTTLITQICTSILLPLLFKGMRPNLKLIMQSAVFYGVTNSRKQ